MDKDLDKEMDEKVDKEVDKEVDEDVDEDVTKREKKRSTQLPHSHHCATGCVGMHLKLSENQFREVAADFLPRIEKKGGGCTPAPRPSCTPAPRPSCMR